jgi:Asp/Glu/hydantoin racemase
VRIWYQSIAEIDAHGGYAERLRAHFERVVGDVAEVELHGMPAGTYGNRSPIEVLDSPHLYTAVLARPLMDLAARAERDGFDAFVVGSYSEPFLRELRSQSTIPVLCVFETSLVVGFSVAHLVGLVTLTPDIVWMLHNLVDKAKFTGRVADIRALDPPLTEHDIEKLFADPGAAVESFRTAARTAVEAFADAVIPAEGLLNELVVGAGVSEVDGAPVIDGIGATLLHAVTMVRLRQRTGLGVGRRWHYRNTALNS